MRRALAWLTALGRWCLLSGLFGVAIGLGFGWIELTGLGVTLLAIVAAAGPWTAGRGPRHVSLVAAPQRVMVGGRAVARVTASAPEQHGVRGVRIEVPTRSGQGARRLAVDVERLRPGDTARHELRLPTDRRSVIEIGPVQAVRADPFGVMRRTVATGEVHRLYVHPVVVPLPSIGSGLLRDLEGRTTADPSPSDATFHALREYLPGDDWRHVHWRTSARQGRLMVQQFVDNRRAELTVQIAGAAAEYADDDEFELAVSVAASIGVRALTDGIRLRVGGVLDRRPTPTPVALLDALSGVEPTPEHPGTPAMMRTLYPRPAGDLVVLTGTHAPLVDLAAALPVVDSPTLIIQVRRGAPVARHRSGRFLVLELGAVTDLARALRLVGLAG